MARRFFQLAVGIALIQTSLPSPSCHAQNPAPASTTAAATSPTPSENGPKGKRGRVLFDREKLTPEQQKRYDGLSPDQQAKMRENWERWQNMTPDERKFWQESEKQRRQKMLQEIDEAIQQSGLQLDDKTREEYAKRYAEERRKIEQKLQKEIEEERRPLVQALIERLKEEFQDKSSPVASPGPASSATPSPSN